LRWIAFLAAEVYPMVEIVDYPERFAPAGEAAEALRESARERIRARLLILEANVAGPWILASGFSAADIYAAMFTRWRNDVGLDWLAAGHIPKILALAEAVGARPKIAPVWKRHFPKG
jgi:glutathione S-transferase